MPTGVTQPALDGQNLLNRCRGGRGRNRGRLGSQNRRSRGRVYRGILRQRRRGGHSGSLGTPGRTICKVLLVEGIELGFRYASVTIRVEILEGRGATRATGTARTIHAFRSGTEFTTRRRTLTETAVTLRASFHAIAFGATVKLTARGRTLAEATVATFPTSGRRTEAFTVTIELAAGRGTLAEAAVTTFAATGRTIAFTVAIEITAWRRTLAEVVATLRAALHADAIGAAIEIAAGRGTLAITAIVTFTASGRAVAFAVAVELAARRRTLAITTITTFGAAIFRSGELRVAITTAGTFRIPTQLRARARRPFRSRPFLGTDHAAQTNQAERAETTGKEHRRPDTALLKESFAAHLAILLTVRRALSASWVSISGAAPIGRVIRPSSCPTVAPKHNDSRHGHITSS